jgi:hypothetical protein
VNVGPYGVSGLLECLSCCVSTAYGGTVSPHVLSNLVRAAAVPAAEVESVVLGWRPWRGRFGVVVFLLGFSKPRNESGIRKSVNGFGPAKRRLRGQFVRHRLISMHLMDRNGAADRA